MEQPESSLPYSQAPATCPYPEPAPSTLYCINVAGVPTVLSPSQLPSP